MTDACILSCPNALVSSRWCFLKFHDFEGKRMLHEYEACVISILMCGLHVSWLNQAERTCLNSFHYKCLRRIINIPHSYLNRTANTEVLEFSSRAAIAILTPQNCIWFRRWPNQIPYNASSDLYTKDESAKRRRGRQIATCMQQVHTHAEIIPNSLNMLHQHCCLNILHQS